MSRSLVAYAAALVAVVAADFLWLGYLARAFYRAELGALLLQTPNWTAAAVFYLLYPTGIVIFAVRPHDDAASFAGALGRGALFGLFAYGTYDLSNLATLAGWSLRVTIVDLLWGMALSALAAGAGHAASARITRV
jgi:uncharacterized membrane protein